MNRQISRVAIVALLLLAALVVATTYWQSWQAPSLAAKQDNAIQRVAQFTIRRGLIYASDGKTVFAANTAKKEGGQTLYLRRYPTNGLASQTIGYSTQGRSRAGIERSQNAYLTASNANLGTIFEKIADSVKGTTVKGNNLVLNLRVNAQKIAETDLSGKCGAAVVLNPKTGQVYVMASSPGYNPNKIESSKGYASILKSPQACPGSSSPLLNRATQGLYPPGSTFKTVTAAAGLDGGVYTIDSRFDDPGYCTEYGQKVSNALNPEGSAEAFGNVDLLQAYQHSINAVFCNIGQKLGAAKVIDKAKDFGFYSKPPIELPSGEIAASGEYSPRHTPFTDPHLMDPGRLAFGQDKLLVTPLQMALVAAAVANNGTIMEPHLVNKVTSSKGGTVVKVKPQVWKHAMKPSTAAALNQMMQAVVTGGTGTSAQIPGIKVAGKTGTAETGIDRVYDAWFIFFAPADDPQVAGAVVVEHANDGFGGSVSAPIAKQLMQAILPGTANK
ncbi:MAG TPA: penicillin-binding transpeptidase domain-containing protein [Gaiellaceae bacterium]|jgi:peptidoglycan glycosyltransferase|nr:penicillin-binding transpeptidase domain-containing protein [Gaiellaceae bacterium]